MGNIESTLNPERKPMVAFSMLDWPLSEMLSDSVCEWASDYVLPAAVDLRPADDA